MARRILPRFSHWLRVSVWLLFKTGWSVFWLCITIPWNAFIRICKRCFGNDSLSCTLERILMFNLSLFRYNLIFLAMTYGIPMLAMGVCYTVISRVLWGGSHIGELNQRHVDAIRSKRKVSVCFIIILSRFLVLTWLPSICWSCIISYLEIGWWLLKADALFEKMRRYYVSSVLCD